VRFQQLPFHSQRHIDERFFEQQLIENGEQIRMVVIPTQTESLRRVRHYSRRFDGNRRRKIVIGEGRISHIGYRFVQVGVGVGVGVGSGTCSSARRSLPAKPQQRRQRELTNARQYRPFPFGIGSIDE